MTRDGPIDTITKRTGPASLRVAGGTTSVAISSDLVAIDAGLCAVNATVL